MADRIKGITVEIGGDTTGLSTALREVNGRTRDLQKELKDVEKLLKFDPNNVELLAQRQQLLTQSIEATTDKLNQLKEAEQQVQRQFERGEIGEEQYRAFRREIQDTEQSLRRYEESLQDMQGEQERVAQGTRQLTTLFEATGSSVEDYANVIGQRLVRAIQNGTATSRDLEYAFQRIGRQAIGADGDIDRLRTTLASVDSGNSLDAIRRDISQIASEAEEASGAVQELGGEISAMVAGLAAGAGISEVIQKALDTSSLNTQIDITFAVPEESKAAVKEAVKGIEAYGIDVESALEGVRRQWSLNKTLSDEVNAGIVKGAATIAKSYSAIDFTELIQETHEMALSMEMTHDEALGLVNSLLKVGFPPDQLDIITEYGSQLTRAGYDAKEIQAIFQAGVETGTWNIDVLLDGLKEGRIVLAEFGDGLDKATTELIQGTGISAKQLQQWGKAVAGGGEAGSQAMIEVAKAVEGIEDATKRNLVGVKIFGTLYEENGSLITQTLTEANNKVIDFTANQDALNESTKKLDSDPAIKLQKALADMQNALTPLLTKVAEFVTKVADWISQNPKLAATITAVVTAVGILLGIMMAIAPIFTALSAVATTLGVGLGALMGAIAGIVAVVGLVIAEGVLLWKNWEKLGEKSKLLQLAITAITGPIGMIVASLKTFKKLVEEGLIPLDKLKKAFSDLADGDWKGFWSNLGQFFSESMKNVKKIVKEYLNQLKTEIATKFEEFKTVAKEKLEEWKNDIITWFSDRVADIKNKLNEWKISIVNWFIEQREAIVQQLNEWKVSIENWFASIPGVIRAKLEEWAKAIAEWAVKQHEENKRQFAEWGRAIEEWFTSIPEKIRTKLEEWKTTITTWYDETKQMIINKFSEWAVSIEEWFTSIPEKIKTKLEEWKTAITNWYDETKENIITKLSEWGTSIETWFTNMPSNIRTWFDEWKNNMAQKFTETKETIKLKLEEWWQSIKQWFTDLPNKSEIKNAGKNMIDKVSEGNNEKKKEFIDKLGKIIVDVAAGALAVAAIALVAAGRELIKRIIDGIKEVDLKSTGEDIISGLISGMSNMIGSVMKKAREIAGSIKKTIEGALDINSPSRVMMEIGEYTGEGLAIGLSNSLGQISKMSEKMANAATPNINTPNMPTVPQNSATFNFEGMLSGANFIVRSDNDIKEIARELGNYMKSQARGKGVLYP